MAWRLFLRISSVLLLILIAFDLATLPPVAAQQQSGLVGTWALQQPDGNGGENFSWYTFTANGQYQLVSAIQGGRNNGSVVQRWGTYQSRSTGPNTYQVAIRITGGAPTQVCAAGQGCTPVQGIQRSMNLAFQVSGNALRQSDGTIFQRGTVPAQLQARMPSTRSIAPVPQSPAIHNGGATSGSATNIPGLGNNCDNAQQNRICTVNGGRMYTDNRGCQVCAGP
jgi:hypothetical protein